MPPDACSFGSVESANESNELGGAMSEMAEQETSAGDLADESGSRAPFALSRDEICPLQLDALRRRVQLTCTSLHTSAIHNYHPVPVMGGVGVGRGDWLWSSTRQSPLLVGHTC